MTLDTNNCLDNIHATIKQEYKIVAEYKMIQSEDVGGIYVIPSYDNSFFWFGVIFIRNGLYNDGIFRFTITLPEQFPNDTKTPTVIFQSEIIHPLISPYTGELELSDYFPIWNCNENHIWQMLKFLKYLFENPIQCTVGKTVNKDAVELLLNNRNEFIVKTKECVRISRDKIYDPAPMDDRHYIQFERYDKNIHDNVLDSIIKINTKDQSFNGGSGGSSILPNQSTTTAIGLSWVNEGEFKPLSK